MDDATESFVDWLRLHATQLAVGAAAVVVLGGAAWFIRSNSASKNVRSEQAFYQAQTPLATGNTAAAEKELRQVADRYDGTAGGAQAAMLLAQILFDQGKYQDGLTLLKKAEDAPDALRDGVLALEAAGLEGLGKYADAAKRYEELAERAPTPGRRADLRANAGRDFQMANDLDAARRIWTDLARDESTAMADEARVRLGELSARAVK